MNREEKLELAAEPGYIHAFRQGLFAKLYEQSLWRFVHQVRPLKPLPERVKGGQPVLYGGLPLKSFEALAAENKLPGLEQMEYGWRWPTGDEKISPGYEEWRSAALRINEEMPARRGRRIFSAARSGHERCSAASGNGRRGP